MADGWAQLGAALGGDQSELAYQQGLNLGARTQEALATARKRVSENTARETLGESFKKIGLDPAYADIALADVDPRQSLEATFRARAGRAGATPQERNEALAGVASGPVETYRAVGSRGYQNVFDPEAGVMPLLGDAFKDAGGGRSAQIQLLDALGELGPDDKVVDQARAISALRQTQQVIDAGGVPKIADINNPYRQPAAPGTPGGIPGVGEVASNVGTIAEAKDLGEARAKAVAALPQAASRYRNQTAQAELVLGNLGKAIGSTNMWTAGPGGKVLGFIPGTAAFDLKSRIDQVRASAGFKGLQDMRYESPTGGALGQVAVQELVYLQALLGNLETAQSPSQLVEMMQQTQAAYGRFKKFARDDYNAARLTASGDFNGAAELVASATAGYEPPDVLAVPGNPNAAPAAAPDASVPTATGPNGEKLYLRNGQWSPQ